MSIHLIYTLIDLYEYSVSQKQFTCSLRILPDDTPNMSNEYVCLRPLAQALWVPYSMHTGHVGASLIHYKAHSHLDFYLVMHWTHPVLLQSHQLTYFYSLFELSFLSNLLWTILDLYSTSFHKCKPSDLTRLTQVKIPILCTPLQYNLKENKGQCSM